MDFGRFTRSKIGRTLCGNVSTISLLLPSLLVAAIADSWFTVAVVSIDLFVTFSSVLFLSEIFVLFGAVSLHNTAAAAAVLSEQRSESFAGSRFNALAVVSSLRLISSQSFNVCVVADSNIVDSVSLFECDDDFSELDLQLSPNDDDIPIHRYCDSNFIYVI